MDLGLIITWSLVGRPGLSVSETGNLACALLSRISIDVPTRAIFSSPAVYKRKAHMVPECYFLCF